MGGISYLFFLRQLIHEVENDWPGVLKKLEAIRQRLITRSTMLCNVTLDEKNWQSVAPRLHAFIDTIPAQPSDFAEWHPEFGEGFEGLTIPAQVNYVGKAANIYESGYKLHGSTLVINNFLRTTWLWDRVRVQGGAYGGFSSFDRRSGVFSFGSYRDPNLLQTIENYDRAAQFLREVDLNEMEIRKSIIGTIADFDAYEASVAERILVGGAGAASAV
jgi:Zn-dependent M16 (insulinase) family peptidase